MGSNEFYNQRLMQSLKLNEFGCGTGRYFDERGNEYEVDRLTGLCWEKKDA